MLLWIVPAGCEVLLLRRNHTLVGEWCQIAGAIEEGEKAWEARLLRMSSEFEFGPMKADHLEGTI